MKNKLRNTLMLAIANLRKSKSQTVAMLILVLIAAMFLNIGLVLFLGAGNFFDERAEELNTSHFATFHPESDPINAPLKLISDFPGVTEIETQSILWGMGNILVSDEPFVGYIIISGETAEQHMNPPSLIGEHLPLTGNAIYIPHFLFLNSGFTLGDDFRLDFMGEELLFTVAGSTEEIMFGSDMNSVWRVYVSALLFTELQEQFHNSRSILISARMPDGGEALSAAFRIEEFDDITMNYSHARYNRTLIPVIAASMMVVLAITLLVVGVIVIRFRINNDIEESMKNIGVLKAVGYRSHQIILSITLQFGLIAFVGGLVGILLSQAMLPIVTSMLEPVLGLRWNPAFNLPIMLAALGVVLIMVLLFSYIASRRIKKLHPLIALRGGITTHNFTKNSLPLDKIRGSLGFLLALKHLLKNKTQAVMISLIIAAVTLVAVVSLLIHYNFNTNTSAFMRLFGEFPDALSFVASEDAGESADFRERMEQHPELELIFGYDSAIARIDDTAVRLIVVEDFSYLAGNDLVSGRLPILSNEVVLDNLVLSEIGKSTGDWVTIRSGENESDYIITGVIQMINSFVGMINVDGIRQLQPDFDFTAFHIYLSEGADVDIFIDAYNAANEDLTVLLVSTQRQFDGQMGAMGNIFAAVDVAIQLAAATVIILVLYLVIKTIIIRRKRDLGIQRALGFTTFQLMNQIALSLSPSILLGVTLGAIVGYIVFNPMVAAILSMMSGIIQPNLLTPLGRVAGATVAIILLAYIFSMLIAWRIRKISAYALVSEI